MQNQYNNYLKRQKQQPINNFKEKVRNSLSGKTVNNTTMPSTANTPKVVGSTNKVGTGIVSGISTPVQTPNNTNSRAITPNASQTPLNAPESTSVTTTPVNSNQPVNNNVEGIAEGGAGLMSLSDVNSALALTPETTSGYNVNPKGRSSVYNPLDQNAIVPGTGGMTQAEYEAEAKRKLEAGIALDNPELYNKYLSQSTPYKLADQILQSQKEQADKGWQLQEQMFQQQQEALNKQYEQSKLEAENAYKQSVDTLNEQRYNQMEDLNVSGTNRGIQYSPQQLGLENVANINHNKNLAETSNKRNELLNKLQIEMNNSLAQLNMGHLQNYNDYQNKLNGYQTDYFEKLMNWNREDNKTQDERDWEQKLLEEKRKWEEAQAQKDKDFQQMMQEMQNKFDKDQQDSQNNWQSGENVLDRNHDKEMASKSRSGGGYSGYSSRGYSGYSRSYNPYSRGYYNGYQNYDGGMPELSSAYLDDEIAQQAVDNNFKRLSTDAYNAVDSGGVDDLMERASYYDEFTSPMYDAYYGLNKTVDERLDNTRETALKHMFNKSYARSTNTAYNIGDTVYQSKAPLRQDYIDKVKSNKERTKSKYLDKYSKNEKAKQESRFKAKTESIHEKVMSKNTSSTKSKNNKSTKNTNSSKYNEINKKLGAKNVASIKKQQEKKKQQKSTKQQKAKKQQQKRNDVNKKLGAKNQAYIKKQQQEKKKQKEKVNKFKKKVKSTVKKIFKKK